VYTPTELGVFGGFGDFGCFDCFGGFHDLLPMLRHCTPPARASVVLSMVSIPADHKLKCRWFFGRVFSFPLVEEFV